MARAITADTALPNTPDTRPRDLPALGRNLPLTGTPSLIDSIEYNGTGGPPSPKPGEGTCRTGATAAEPSSGTEPPRVRCLTGRVLQQSGKPVRPPRTRRGRGALQPVGPWPSAAATEARRDEPGRPCLSGRPVTGASARSSPGRSGGRSAGGDLLLSGVRVPPRAPSPGAHPPRRRPHPRRRVRVRRPRPFPSEGPRSGDASARDADRPTHVRRLHRSGHPVTEPAGPGAEAARRGGRAGAVYRRVRSSAREAMRSRRPPDDVTRRRVAARRAHTD
jgi:hypothetical protein